MSDIGDVALVAYGLEKLVFAALHPAQQKQIKEALSESTTRVNLYKDALSGDDIDTQRRLELGLLSGIPADFGPGEIDKLESKPSSPGFNQLNQLGWFQRAEGERFASKVIEIIRTNTDTSSA